MPASTKPRKAYRPRPTAVDSTGLAMARATKLAPWQQDALRSPMQRALTALRQAAGGWQAWCAMADAVNVAEQLAVLGIASDRQADFNAAQKALQALHARVNEKGTWALYASELAALDMACTLHIVQLQYCSQGEMHTAISAVQRRTREALRGNASHRTTVCVGALQGSTPTDKTPA